MISLKHKIFLVLLGLLVALFAGIYLSGWILLTWVHSHQSTEFTTIFQYLYHYSDHPVHGTKIKISAFIGFLAPLLLLIFFAAALLVRKEENLYGKARFAKSSELQKAGFFKSTENSIVVGKQGNQYLFYSGQQFALLAAPTRSGKGVGIVIPNLLSYQGSMVVLDIKQENFDLTSGFREKHGQKVYLFNPSPKTNVHTVGTL